MKKLKKLGTALCIVLAFTAALCVGLTACGEGEEAEDATYTITFETNGGSALDDAEWTTGTALTVGETTRTGYTFAGWYYDAALENAVTLSSFTAEGDTIIYAKWTANTYTVTFETNGGTALDAAEWTYGTALTTGGGTTRTGYTFEGWYYDEELENAVTIASFTTTEDTTVYAKWTIDVYTVTFETNGGSEVDAADWTYGTALTAGETTRTGYTFAGWYYDAALENAVTLSSFTADGNTTVYAKWTANTYTITFETNGGSTVAAMDWTYGTELEADSPTRSGYFFVGWYYDEELEDAAELDELTVAADATLYAKWSKWTTTEGTATYTETDTSVTVSAEYNWKKGFVLTQSSYTDNYKITVDISAAADSYGTGTGAEADARLGIVPFYLDDDNFVVIWLQWYDNGTLRNIGGSGLLNGEDIGWLDMWSFENTETSLTSGQTLTIVRQGSAIIVTFAGTTAQQEVSGIANADSNLVGVWVQYLDNIVYSNFTVTEELPTSTTTWSLTSHVYDASLTYDESAVTLNSGSNWLAAYAITESAYTDNYTFSVTVTAPKNGYTSSDNVYIGLLPYYVDESNYIVMYLQWNDNGMLKSIGCTGYLDGTDVGWNDRWSFAGIDTSLIAGQTLIVTRSGKTFTVEFAGKSEEVTFDSLDGKENGYVGFWSQNAESVFSDFAVTAYTA